MKKELLIVILVVIGIIGISALLRYVVFKDYAKTSANYSEKPLAECVQCINNKTWENKPCCDSGFSQQCSDKNGVIRFKDLRPDFAGLLQECYMSAPDTGKECALESDCMSGFCDLESAITSNKCVLKTRQSVATTYSCSSNVPGRCASAPENISSKVSPSFRMEGRNLIVVQ